MITLGTGLGLWQGAGPVRHTLRACRKQPLIKKHAIFHIFKGMSHFKNLCGLLHFLPNDDDMICQVICQKMSSFCRYGFQMGAPAEFRRGSSNHIISLFGAGFGRNGNKCRRVKTMMLITALRTDVKEESAIILMSHAKSFLKEGKWSRYGLRTKIES